MRVSLSLLLVLVSLSAFADEARFTVTRVINGKSFVTQSGETVRIASIEAPNVYDGRPGEPLGDEAKAALESLILGKTIRLEYAPGKRDRHGRLLGQVYTQDGTWIEGALLKKGYAMAYSFNDDSPETITKMITCEREAQALKRGIWAHPYYRILAPADTPEFVNRFKLVEGKVVSVNMSHGNVYINFSEHWKGNFYVFISHTYAEDFAPEKLQALVGKIIRVRGWIHYHNAPTIDITRPEQIEMQ